MPGSWPSRDTEGFPLLRSCPSTTGRNARRHTTDLAGRTLETLPSDPLRTAQVGAQVGTLDPCRLKERLTPSCPQHQSFEMLDSSCLAWHRFPLRSLGKEVRRMTGGARGRFNLTRGCVFCQDDTGGIRLGVSVMGAKVDWHSRALGLPVGGRVPQSPSPSSPFAQELRPSSDTQPRGGRGRHPKNDEHDDTRQCRDLPTCDHNGLVQRSVQECRNR
jgi:hypothetical protein